MASLTIRKISTLTMGGGSSVRSDSKSNCLGILMQLNGESNIVFMVKTVNTFVVDLSIDFIDDYVVLSTPKCIGTSIQAHGPPPIVDSISSLQSSAVFTVFSYHMFNFFKNKYILQYG